jgi:hypothetical protein
MFCVITPEEVPHLEACLYNGLSLCFIDEFSSITTATNGHDRDDTVLLQCHKIAEMLLLQVHDQNIKL